MRSWMCAIDAVGAVVTIVQDSSRSSLAGSRHVSHSPAIANGSRLCSWM